MEQKQYAIIKQAIFIVVNFVSFPCVYFVQLSHGLDPSWIFALNYINNSNEKFGESYFFTYGPLGFLGHCQSVGNNLYFGAAFWIVVTVVQIYLYKRLFDYSRNIGSVLLASVLVLLAFPVSEADIYLCFLALAALLLVYKYEDAYSKWIAFFLSGVVFLFKFSGTVLLVATLLLLLICATAEKKPGKMIGFFVGCMAAGPACYLFYHPSVRSLLRYIRAAAEISFGYNKSMSVDVYEAYYVWVILIVVCYVFLLLYGIFKHKKDWNCLFILSPACFFWYKEGFVRNDGHHLLAVSGMLLVCVLLLFFVDMKEWIRSPVQNAWPKIMACCFCMMVVIPAMGSGKTVAGSIQVAEENMFRLPKVLYDCQTQDLSLLQEHNKEFMEIIGKESYTTFPWEITENISYKNHNFMIPPLLQNYTVYTPYLDKVNAGFYSSSDAPEYMILYLSTIDGRLPFIEAPATWEKIYQNYCIVASDEEKFLLKKREQPLEKEIFEVSRSACGTKEYIQIPEHCTFVKLNTSLGLRGHLENLFYKILPVDLKVTYMDGTVKSGRVLLDHLREGTSIRSLVRDSSDFQKYMDADNSNPEFLCGGGVQG